MNSSRLIGKRLLLHPKRLDLVKGLSRLYATKTDSIYITPFGSESVARSGIVTASKIANLLNLGYVPRYKYMQELLNPDLVRQTRDDPDSFAASAKNHGSRFEKHAADIFIARSDRYKQIGNSEEQYTYTVIFQEASDPAEYCIAGTPDLLIWDTKKNRTTLLEIKCPYVRWLAQTDITENEAAWDLYADKHYAQCQIQMLLTGVQSMFLMFYVPDRDGSDTDNYSLFKIRPDEQYQDFLIAHAYQAYQEIKNSETNKFKIITNETAHNRVITSESKINHSTLII